MTIEIRPIQEAELPGWIDCVSTGFLERPAIDLIVDEVRTHWDLGRTLAAVDGGRIVGTARTWPTELTVPGNARVNAGALTGVTVRPTHRRRGLLRGMLAAMHAAARDRGEMATLLYASEYPIYGRFGYGPATQTCGWSVDLTTTGFHDAAGGRSGTIDLVPVDEQAIDPIRDVFEAWRRIQPGEIWRRPITWRSDLGLAGAAWGDAPWKGFVAVHRDDAGTIDGYVRYHADAKWEHRQPRHALIVDELHGLTGEAQVALWRFVASVDLARSIRAERRSPADRLPWLLTNARAAETFEAGDSLWVTLHDIAAALETRTYERSGSLVLEVLVRDAGEDDAAAGRVRVALDASPDGARAVETERAADLTIDGGALGAAYLGGTRLRDAVLARGWDEHRPGALAEADALLASREPPWCTTSF